MNQPFTRIPLYHLCEHFHELASRIRCLKVQHSFLSTNNNLRNFQGRMHQDRRVCPAHQDILITGRRMDQAAQRISLDVPWMYFGRNT